MSNRSRGRRGSQGDGWTWDDDESGGPNRPPNGRLPLAPILALVIIVAALVAAGVFIVAGGDDESGLGALPTASRTATTSAPSAQKTSTSSPTNQAQPTFTFAAWSRSLKSWQTSSLEDGGYLEGAAIPIMIRINNTTSGTVYDLKLRYDCASGSASAFDFLAGVSSDDFDAFTTAPGPERSRPDTTLPMPDDPSIPYDDGVARLFRVWGGIFDQPPVGPLPAAPCEGDKQLSLTVRAHADAVFLIIGAHLASAADWGEGKGASTGSTTLTLEAAVYGAPAQTITIAPGTIRR